MEKFNNHYERTGYYYIQYKEAEGWREKAKCLFDWYRDILYKYGGFSSNAEWYLYEECVDELLDYFSDDYEEEDYEWYEAEIQAISDDYLLYEDEIRAVATVRPT